MTNPVPAPGTEGETPTLDELQRVLELAGRSALWARDFVACELLRWLASQLPELMADKAQLDRLATMTVNGLIPSDIRETIDAARLAQGEGANG
jgi:hypothetical protein